MEDFDFIEKYVKLMSNISDAPEEFFRSSAIYLLSTVVGRKFIFLSAPEVEIFSDTISGKLLNMWFIIIGKSRITRKSTVLSKAEQYIEYIDPNLLLPKDFTPESFIKDLSEKCIEGETYATWIHDEVSGFFTALKKKEYMVSTDTIMSRIYDGRDYVRETISRGKELIKRPYLTILVSSTEYLPSLFLDDHLRQGFLNRFIFVYCKRNKWKNVNYIIDDEIITELRNLGNYLKSIRTYPNTIPMSFTSGAKEIFDEYESKIEDMIENEDLGIKEGFYGNMPNNLIKISSLFRISRMTIDDIYLNDKILLTIEEEDVEKGIEYIEKTKEWFEEVIRLMKLKSERKTIFTDESNIEYIKYILKENNGIMKKSELLKKSKLSYAKFSEIIETLKNRKEIEIETGESSGGRKPILIKLVS